MVQVVSSATNCQSFQFECEHDKLFGSLSIIDEDGCLCLPPLDLITACSEDDDASSVSSMSSNVDDFEAQPRSIFGAYWEKTGSRSTLFSDTDNQGHKRILSKDPNLATFETYEHSVSSLFTEQDKASTTGNRRKIFGTSGGCSFTQSESNLAGARLASGNANFRKSLSSSAIYSSKPRSCLRRGRFSFKADDHLQSRGGSSSSVSFKKAIDVVVYQQPIEQHAQKGWSKFFF